MQTNNYCSLPEAAFAFFPLRRRGFFWKIICAMLSRMTLVFGFTRIPKFVAQALRTFRENEGEANFCGEKLDLIIFKYDLNTIPKEEHEDYIVECHERIIERLALRQHPVVWIFGPEKLLRALSEKFLEGGALTYYHSRELERGDVHALIVDELTEPFYFPKPFFVHEKFVFHGFVPN